MITKRRKRSANDTRTAILAATRRIFAEHGYDRATIRSIACEAGCDPALVIRYFGSKRGLLEAAVHSPLETFPDAPPGKSGDLAALAEAMLETWHEDHTFIGLLRAAASDPESAAMMRDFFDERIRRHQPRVTGLPPDQAVIFGSMLVGIAFTREITRIPPLDQMSSKEIAALLASLLAPPASDGPADE